MLHVCGIGPYLSHPHVIIGAMTDDARQRALDENARRSRVMADAQRFGPPGRSATPDAERCTRNDHPEWTLLRDDHGRPLALACTVCMATLPVPEAEPGVRLVALPAGWEDDPD